MTFLEALERQVLILDGAMGTQIQALDVTDADFGGSDFRMLGDILTFSRPADIEEIHLAYYRAGANGVETNSFGASPFRLSEYDFSVAHLERFPSLPDGFDLPSASYEAIAYALSRESAAIAGRARERFRQEEAYEGQPLFVMGSMGPSNRVISSTEADLTRSTFDEISENFYHQILGLIDGGADVLLFETQQDILEVKAAVAGAKQALRERGANLPIVVEVTVDQFSKMQIFNTDIHAALVTVESIGIDVFGINCSIGPDLMAKTVEKIARYSKLPISVVPNAGLPVSEDGRTVYSFEPALFAGYLDDFVTQYGVNIVGGCCGTGPAHVRAVADRLKGRSPQPRAPEKGLYISGPQEAVHLHCEESLVMVGERLNARGSAKVRDAVEREGDIDHAVLEEVVSEQIKTLGLTVIDVCMDSNIVETTETLKAVIQGQTADFSGAMSLDSFSFETLREAVKVYPGRPIINSMSLEEVAPGVTKIEAVIRATEGHHPVYVALTAGPDGPAATREKKCELAREILDTAGKFGVAADQIFVDMNVFPLGAESEPNINFALESLESIPLIKALDKDVRTICGVGNLTNGLAKKPYMRKVLTSVWLDEARQRGLDAAIVNPNHFVFVKDLDPGDYALARKAILERDMEAFEELEDIAVAKQGVVAKKRSGYGDLGAEEAICAKVIDGHKEREEGSVEIDGHSYVYADKIVELAADVVNRHEPLAFINDYLMKAMQELGDGFGRGDVSLPHLLKSADVMKQVMAFLEEYMNVRSGVELQEEIQYKGVIVIGTVYQDVHSIGKDLAKTLFENYGYRVIDLGVMTPLQEYIDKAKEHNADAIGMSALLVQTSNHMITVSKMMLDQGLEETHVLIGGAPVNDRHAAYVALAGGEEESQMRANVFYCATAMDAVNVMNSLKSADDPSAITARNKERLRGRFERAKKRAEDDANLLATLPRRSVSFTNHLAPGNGLYFAPEKVDYALVDFRPHINKKNLYSLNWRFGGKRARSKQGITEEELERLFLEWTERADTKKWLRPQGVMGIFPGQSEGEEVVVYDSVEARRELCRFDFDVVIGAGREDTISSAQYFRPASEGAFDYVGLQIANAGPQIEDQLARFKEANDSESSLLLQGLSDRLAEDMAACLHGILRERTGLAGTQQGTRWSPGYPAITNVENNKRIHAILDAENRIGVAVTEAGEFSPTGCTAAIVSFHPDARYS